MAKQVVGLVGVFVFLAGIFLWFYFQKEQQLAASRDKSKTVHGIISGEFMPCAWEVQLPERVLSENKSQTLIVNASNKTNEKCESEVSLLVPGFDFAPHKESQTIAAAPKGKGSIAWVLTPREAGSYELAISDGITTETKGVQVTNTFGLNAGQAQVVSVLGTLFGPMITIPWWFEKWYQRRKQSQTPPLPTKQTA